MNGSGRREAREAGSRPRGGMAARGVTRPMAEQESGVGESHEDGDHDGGGGHGEPYSAARYRMLEAHHRHTLWVYWTLILLGVWTALAPFTFGYLNERLWVEPAGGRGVWFGEATHTSLRALLMTWSDVASGLLLVVLGARSLLPDRPRSLWLACGVGVWLNAAPLLFWAPTPAGYLNGTLVGMLVIALTILVPGMPNMILYMRGGPPVPPGWSYNPSSWLQRWILVATGFLGLLASRALAMFQLGYVDRAWDPFFGAASTERVLSSKISHSLPVSDAALGTFAYTLEFLMAYMGSPSRWRTMPWMVTLFGVLVIPLGLVHIFLVISQPVVVGAWCTLCLAAAALMLPMIPLEVDEVVAMAQHLVRSKRRGTPFWSAFWKGGPPDEDARADERTPELLFLPQEPRRGIAAMFWGVSAPWTLSVSAVLGVALMALPALTGTGGLAADVHHLCGALIVVTAVVSMGEVVRACRWLDVPLGAIVAGASWLLEVGSPAARWIGLVAGAGVAILALPRGIVRESYGSWDRFVR